jgi:hypothetical protein
LAAVLSSIDINGLSGHDRVVVLRAHQKMAAHYQAQLYRGMVAVREAYRVEELGGGGDDEVDVEALWEGAAAEIGAALGLTRQGAVTALGVAAEVCERFPRLWEALAAGRVDGRRVSVILQAVGHLPAEVAVGVVEQVLEKAGGWTTGQLAAHLRRLVIACDPEGAQQRLQRAEADRRVVAEPSVDGTAHLMILDASPQRVAEARERINRIARALKHRGETRSMDQLRADVALDLLCEGHTASTPKPHRYPGGTVEIQVDLTTLAELDNNPGELAGYGPVIADIARQVAAEADRWEFTVTHPHSGEVICAGVTRRRPTTHQARRIRSRYPRCVFPGCRMPARDCDLDHRQPHSQGGATCDCNLHPLCRHHHRLRHLLGWRYKRDATGVITWTSPLHHTYTKHPRGP